MLNDFVEIKIKSGRGGNGSMAMNMEHAAGGDGGRGGDIYFQGDENIYDLSWFDNGRTYKAGNGEHGAKKHQQGLDGKDLILKVPLQTVIRRNRRLVTIIDHHNQREIALKGGSGGFGNVSISNASKDGVYDQTALPSIGSEGKLLEVNLTLNLQGDVIFLGVPNAGKSSILNLLTDAKVKVAPYAFTTLEPQLGMMEGIVLMDLPGLIENTAEGKGLGTRFVKHALSSKLIAHFVSLTEQDPIATYHTIRKEIEAIDPRLAQLPEILILTKSDEVTPQIISEVKSKFSKINLSPITVSIIDDDALAMLKTLIKETLAKPDFLK